MIVSLVIVLAIGMVIMFAGGHVMQKYGLPHTSDSDKMGSLGKGIIVLGFLFIALGSIYVIYEKVTLDKCKNEPQLEMCKQHEK